MRMHFPCERPKAMPEGRNSSLLAYEAINQTIMNKGVIVTRDWCPEEGEWETENVHTFSPRTPESYARRPE